MFLFNDTLNTFYLRLYGVRHMVKDHSAREETRCRHMGDSFRLAARVLLYASSPPDRITHTTTFVTLVVEHWLERHSSQMLDTAPLRWPSYTGVLRFADVQGDS